MQQRNQNVQKVVDAVVGMEYGDTITHLEMTTLLGEKHGTTKYFNLVRRANKQLLSTGKMLGNIREVGYQIIMPDEYTGVAVKNFAKGFKNLQRGNDVLTNAPTKHMSREGLQAHREVSDRACSLYAAMAGGYTELKLLSKKQHALDPTNVGRA